MRTKDRAASSLSDGFFGRFFTSYDKIEDSFDGGFLAEEFSDVRTSRAASGVRRAVARSMENSAILGAFRSLISSLPWLTVRTYGVFLLSFGLYAAIVFAIKAVATTIAADIDDLVTGVLAAVVSMPLLASGKPLATAVCSSRAASYIAFDMLGFERQDASVERRARQRLDMAFLFGMISGLFTFYFPAGAVIGFIVTAVVMMTVMSRPETGVILIFALFPFLSDAAIGALILATSFSYLVKLMCGRRTLRLGAAETLTLVFFILLVFGQLVHYGAGAGYVVNVRRIVYMFIYFPVVCLFGSDSWRPKLIRALLFGGSALAVISIASPLADNISSLSSTASSTVIANMASWCTQMFDCAAVSSYYLAMIIPVMIAYVLRRGRGGGRFNMIVFSALVITASVMTMSRGLWMGVLVGVAVMLITVDARFVVLPLMATVLAPLAVTVMPRSWAALLDVSGVVTRRRAYIRGVSGRIFADNALGGIGSADGVFETVYDNATSVGASATNAQSLYIQIGVELGAAGLLCFLFAVIFILIKTMSGSRYGVDREKRLCSGALAAGMCAALFSGFSNCIWVDERMFLLFWMFAAASSVYPQRGSVRCAPSPPRTKITGDAGAASADIVIAKAGKERTNEKGK